MIYNGNVWSQKGFAYTRTPDILLRNTVSYDVPPSFRRPLNYSSTTYSIQVTGEWITKEWTGDNGYECYAGSFDVYVITSVTYISVNGGPGSEASTDL